MSIVNRRNALIGWTVLKLTKRVAKQKARDAVPGTVEGTHRPNRSAIALAAASAFGALLFWRRRRGDSDVEPQA